MKECPDCGGDGTTFEECGQCGVESEVECPTCEGTGEIEGEDD